MLTTDEWDEYAGGQAERWLKGVRDARAMADALAEILDQLERDRDGIKATRYDKAGGGSCQDPTAKMDAAVQKLDKAREGLAKAKDRMAGAVSDAGVRLARMEDPVQMRCLNLYYVSGARTWQAVADAMCYSLDGVKKLRRRALVSAYDVMPHTLRDPMHRAD